MRTISTNQDIYLGELFEDLLKQLPRYSQGPLSTKWPQLSFPVDNVIGINALRSTVRAPLLDRPVMQQIFDLSMQEDSSNGTLESSYMEKIGLHFGKAVSEKVFPNRMEWHEVRFVAKWSVSDVTVSLSVFGAPRKSNDGTSTASLFFDLEDEVKVAGPYVDRRRTTEESLWSSHAEFDILCSVNTVEPNWPYFRPNYERRLLKPQDIPEKLRRCQKALYTKSLLETPRAILRKSRDHTVLVWSTGGQVFLTSTVDTVVLNTHSTKVEFHRVLPSRGPGSTKLVVDDLQLSDQADSNALAKLLTYIERTIGIRVERREYYDE